MLDSVISPALTLHDLGQTLSQHADVVVVASERAKTFLAPVLGPHVRWAEVEDCVSSDAIVVAGGGTLIDEVKLRWASMVPKPRLYALPTLWGSGAEVSPVVVVNRNSKKLISVSDDQIPSARVLTDHCLTSITKQQAKDACGDVWAHALEAGLSPMATDVIRDRAFALIRTMTTAPMTPSLDWFERSASACVLQALASVGLIHGIAHQLEGVDATFGGHASLCATLLLPVMQFNITRSERVRTLLVSCDINPDDLLRKLSELFDPARYDRLRSAFSTHWMPILRDPCSRTNCILVRPGYVSFFANFVIA
jgi:alcohol dehydrogenase class IV